MKRMKNKIFSRIIVLTLACILLLSLVSCTSKDYSAYMDFMEGKCAKWSISEDESKLVKNEKTIYKRIETDSELAPLNAFVYYNSLFLMHESVYSSPEGPGKEGYSEIVWICGVSEDSYLIFATEAGEAALREFENGKYYTATVHDTYGAWSYVDLSVLTQADEEILISESKLTRDVTTLKDIERLEVSVYDGTESFCKKYGALYLIDEAWYYINYDTLENDKFDADGNFSYRRGTVELSKLSDELAKKIDIANDSKDILYTIYTYEEDEFVEDFEYEYFDESFGVALFWVVFSLVCLALPAFIAVGAFIVARLDKLGRPKYWYIVSLIALVWIVSSVALMIIILI